MDFVERPFDYAFSGDLCFLFVFRAFSRRKPKNSQGDFQKFAEQALSLIESKTTSNTPLGTQVLSQVAAIKTTLYKPQPYQWETPATITIEQTVFF